MTHHLPEHLMGAADLHVHSAPDIAERRYDDLDLAREAARSGLSALLLKSHQGSTVERAYLVSRMVPGIRLFGGLVLNDPVGGFNVAAVRVALQLGAREIWMPTKSARNHLLHHHGEDASSGLTIFDSSGAIRADVAQILSAMVGSECILATGHLSPEEGSALIRFGHSLGLRRFLVTHPEWSVTFYSESLQRELAALGAMFEPRTAAAIRRWRPLRTRSRMWASTRPSSPPTWASPTHRRRWRASSSMPNTSARRVSRASRSGRWRSKTRCGCWVWSTLEDWRPF